MGKLIDTTGLQALYFDIRDRLITCYRKPVTGIPVTDLSTDLQNDIYAAVAVSDTQPLNPHNIIWIDETAPSAISVPTYAEFTGVIAPDYDDLVFPVSNGDHCIRNGVYYTAKQNINESEEWNSEHWDAGTVSFAIDELHRILVENYVRTNAFASSIRAGLVRVSDTSGISVNSMTGAMQLILATDAQVKAGVIEYNIIAPVNQHKSVFYGLTKAAGVDMSNSNNLIGSYTDEAKGAIQYMLGFEGIFGNYETGTMSTHAYEVGDIFILDGKRYQATAAIAQGGIITPGTNCRPRKLNKDYVKFTDYATSSTPGLIYVSGGGLIVAADGRLTTNPATEANCKSGGAYSSPITPTYQHAAVFYGLSRAAGVNLANETVTLGTYPDPSKQAIQKMIGLDTILGPYESDITADQAYASGETFVMDGKRYKATAAIAQGGVITPGTNCELDPLNGDFVKRTDYGSDSAPGVNQVTSTFGVYTLPGQYAKYLRVYKAENADIKSADAGNLSQHRPIVPYNQHLSIYYGLAKLAGADMASLTGETVGVYPQAQKTAIRGLIDAVGTTDYAGTSSAGVVKYNNDYGISVIMSGAGEGTLRTYQAVASLIKAGTNAYRPITPEKQHESVFYGLSKLAGVDLASGSDVVGVYPQNAKTAIQTMLGIEHGVTLIENVSGSTPSITGQPNVRYKCGEVSTLSITPPSAGSMEVIFTSGSTATVLTVPNTVKFPPWFDTTTLEANTIYDIIITDGVYGAVMSWAS